PCNMLSVRQVWESDSPKSGTDPLGPGITTFVAKPNEPPENVALRMAYEIDEHHGEFGHSPPWTEMDVFEADLSPDLQNGFTELGTTACEVTQNGFVCRR